MNRSFFKRLLISLFGMWCVVYFAGVDWVISTPSSGQHCPKYSNIAGTGVGPAQTNFVFKFIKEEMAIQEVGGTSGAAGPHPAPAGQGNWNGTLVPPAGEPHNGLWPTGTGASVAIYEGSTFKTNQVISITDVP